MWKENGRQGWIMWKENGRQGWIMWKEKQAAGLDDVEGKTGGKAG